MPALEYPVFVISNCKAKKANWQTYEASMLKVGYLWKALTTASKKFTTS